MPRVFWKRRPKKNFLRKRLFSKGLLLGIRAVSYRNQPHICGSILISCKQIRGEGVGGRELEWEQNPDQRTTNAACVQLNGCLKCTPTAIPSWAYIQRKTIL